MICNLFFVKLKTQFGTQSQFTFCQMNVKIMQMNTMGDNYDEVDDNISGDDDYSDNDNDDEHHGRSKHVRE